MRKSTRMRSMALILALSMVFSTPFSVVAKEEMPKAEDALPEITDEADLLSGTEEAKDPFYSHENEKAGEDVLENSLTVEWVTKDGAAYAVLSFSDK